MSLAFYLSVFDWENSDNTWITSAYLHDGLVDWEGDWMIEGDYEWVSGWINDVGIN